MQHRLKKLVLYTSALCNLKCKYCYIVKNKYLNEVHSTLLNSFKNDYYSQFLKKLTQYFNIDEIEEISLWGAEPSLGYKETLPCIKNIVKEYPSIKTIFSSSNFAYDGAEDNLLYLIDYFRDIERKINFTQQISLDGPKDINDFNRGTGVTQSIITNVDLLCSKINNISSNASLRMYFKPTISIEQMYSLCSEKNIIEYFVFFQNNLIDKINKTGTIKTNLPSISFISPGEYTQQDGILFAQFCKICRDIDDKNLFKDTFVTPYRYRALKYKNITSSTLDTFNLRHGFCGLGMGVIGLLPNNKICLCHRAFSSICENYKKDSEKYSNSFTSSKLYSIDENDKFIFDISEAEEKFNIFRKYQEKTSTTILISTSTLIRSLAYCGLILEKYKDFKNSQIAARAVLDIFGQCAKDSYDVTGTISSPFTSTLKLLLNGALDYICEGTPYEL